MTDPFRKQYRQLTPAEFARVEDIKTVAGELHKLLESHPHPVLDGPPNGARELALARTKLEECVMWAVKACT